MTMRPYPAYTPSGIATVGDIPSHWSTPHLGHVSTCLDYLRVPLNASERADRPGDVPYWGANGVVGAVDRALVDGPLVLLGEDGAPFFDRFKDKAFYVDHPIWPNNHIHVLRPSRSVSGRFLTHALNATDYAAWIEGSTRDKLTQGNMTSIPIPLPPRQEQDAIAAFIDRETAKIDALIAKQEQLIATLREDRAATIDDAVSAPEKTVLRRLVDPQRPMTYGILQCGESVVDGVPYIGPSDMQGEGQSPPLESLRRTTAAIASVYRRSVLVGGDLVVSIGPAYGKVAIVDADLAGANLTQDTVRVAALPKLVDSRFLVWVLISHATGQFWDSQITGATFRRLNLGTLARTPIPVTPLQEQRRIVAYLETQIAKIDNLIGKADQLIDTLREYRAALITDAVTGKIDVRGVA